MPVGDGRGLLLVGGQQHGDAVGAGGRGEGAQQQGALGAVQRGRGLVGEDHGGQVREGAGQGDALGLGPVEGAGVLAGEGADVEAVEPFAGGPLGRAVGHARDQQRQGGVLPDPQLGQQLRLGADPAEAVAAQPLAGQGPHRVHGDAVEPDLALLGSQLSGQAAQQCALAAAPGAGHGEDLSRADADRDPDEARRAAVGVVKGPCPEQIVLGRGIVRPVVVRRSVVPWSHHGVHLRPGERSGARLVTGAAMRCKEMNVLDGDSTRPGPPRSHSNGGSGPCGPAVCRLRDGRRTPAG